MRFLRHPGLYALCATTALTLAFSAAHGAELAQPADAPAIQITPRPAIPETFTYGTAEQGMPVITPRYIPKMAQADAPKPAGYDRPAAAAGSYASIYSSIPFNRSEYLANPGYRNDATLSLMLGQPYTSLSSGNYVPQTEKSYYDRYFGWVTIGYPQAYWPPTWGYGMGWGYPFRNFSGYYGF